MNRKDTFTFRINDEEKQLIAFLSTQLQRNPSDAVRLVIREAAKGLREITPRPEGGQHEHNQ